MKKFVCSVCGYTVEGEAPEKCPICGAVKEVFTALEVMYAYTNINFTDKMKENIFLI